MYDELTFCVMYFVMVPTSDLQDFVTLLVIPYIVKRLADPYGGHS